ncbi:hypothetical protein P5673_026897 [Acropora cervicornis]|uniref:Uncharacterized protein n=1 Tax=Acropora cervicornis TaxID=6130 RepID=A0AAD9UWH6_ACRCE|nr:hypothetical protein P5673_026897 [Acropora cervicornis]
MQKYVIAVCVLWLVATATVSFGWSICHQNCDTEYWDCLDLGSNEEQCGNVFSTCIETHGCNN